MRAGLLAIVFAGFPTLLSAEAVLQTLPDDTAFAAVHSRTTPVEVIKVAASGDVLPAAAADPFARSDDMRFDTPVGVVEPAIDPLAFGPFLPPEPPAPIDPRVETAGAAQAKLSRNATRLADMPDAMQRLVTTIEVHVSISDQMMQVYHRGTLIHEWPVSTARDGKVTPRGLYAAEWLSKNHRSKLYDDAPMPFAIFYDGDYAIHGTEAEGRLGRPASSGCVRLSRANAETLFKLVRKDGQENLLVEIRD